MGLACFKYPTLLFAFYTAILFVHSGQLTLVFALDKSLLYFVSVPSIALANLSLVGKALVCYSVPCLLSELPNPLLQLISY